MDGAAGAGGLRVGVGALSGGKRKEAFTKWLISMSATMEATETQRRDFGIETLKLRINGLRLRLGLEYRINRTVGVLSSSALGIFYGRSWYIPGVLVCRVDRIYLASDT